MQRKKTKTISKPKANKTMKKGSQSFSFKLAETMERDFRSGPSKIAIQYGKDLAALRQQEKKLAADLQKADAKHRSAKHKTTVLSSKSTNKKQILSSKKLEASLNKIVSELTSKLQNVKNLCKMASQNQAKFTSLNKQMTVWEKEFVAKVKKELAAKKAKAANPKSRTKKASPASVENMTETQEKTPDLTQEPVSMTEEVVEMN